MRYGMNVQVHGNGDSAVKFLDVCAKAGVMAARLSLSSDDTIHESVLQRVIAAATANGQKVVLTLIHTTPELAERHAEDYRKGGWADLVDAYSSMSALVKPKDCLGVVLPQGMHLITRVSNKPGAFGLKREQITTILNKVGDAIRAAGHPVVMPMRLDDVQGQVYKAVRFDVIELDSMLSPEAESTWSRAMIDGAMPSSVPYWFGRAGMLGGYIVPAQQARFLRKLEAVASGAELAFLWSEEGSDKWAWSKSGEMLLELMPGLTQPPAVKLGGNPAIAHWKAQERRKL